MPSVHRGYGLAEFLERNIFITLLIDLPESNPILVVLEKVAEEIGVPHIILCVRISGLNSVLRRLKRPYDDWLRIKKLW